MVGKGWDTLSLQKVYGTEGTEGSMADEDRKREVVPEYKHEIETGNRPSGC